MGVPSYENGVEPPRAEPHNVEDRTVPSGHYGNLTTEQQSALDDLHQKVSIVNHELGKEQIGEDSRSGSMIEERKMAHQKTNLEKNDKVDAKDEEHHRMLLRFLRARSFNVSDAFEMYTKDREWRSQHGIDSFLEKPPKKLDFAHSCVPGAHHKFDKYGRPIRIEKMGQLLSSRVPELFSQEEYHMVHAWDMEYSIQQMRESSQRTNTEVETLVFIGDMSGLTMQARKAIWLVKAISAMDELHYPERCGVVFLINCPWIFPALYNNLVRPFLDPVVAQKVRVYDHCPTEELLEMIDADSLPKMYGGNCTCTGKDECVPSPTEEAIQNALDSMTPKDLTKHRISASRKVEVSLQVDENSGAALGWYFKMGTKGGDIDFSATWHPTSSPSASQSRLRKSKANGISVDHSPRSDPGEALEYVSTTALNLSPPKNVLRKNRSCPESLDIPRLAPYCAPDATHSRLSSDSFSGEYLDLGRSASVGAPELCPEPGKPFKVFARESVKVDRFGSRGEFLAQTAGTLVLRWDNTSRIYKKTVEVHVSKSGYMQKIEGMTQ